jgi:hypothetical protein
VQFTIESRELRSQHARQSSADRRPQQTVIEASTVEDAISEFVRLNASELVSMMKPVGRESIATVKKDDSVFLVRVYSV